jgi:3-hydroxyisobutyrate dehydrogenase
VVYDIQSGVMNEFKSLGAKTASSPTDMISQQPDVIITMLPSSQHVKEVYLGAQGVFESKNLYPLLCIDSSTIDPLTSRSLARTAEGHNIDMIDAPVSGGVHAAEQGTLTFMVGGPHRLLDRATAYLNKMGRTVIHCGDHGAGQIVKLCNNLLLSISMIGTAEAMSLGLRWGIDRHVLASVINQSSGRCWSSEHYNPCPDVMENVPSSRNYEGGFKSSLMVKDLGLILEMTQPLQLPMGQVAHHIYQKMLQKGYGLKDFSSVYAYLNSQ